MASPISTTSSVSLTQGNQSPSTALQTATALFAPTQSLAAFMEGKSAEPSRPILYKPFGFLKSIDLRTVGLKLEDIPYKFGWDLVLFGKSSVCQKSGEPQEPFGASGREIGATDELFLFEHGLDDINSFGLFPEQETGAETGPEIFRDDLGEDLSKEVGGSSGQLEESPVETEQATPVPQTGEKRKRYKIVARRTRMPRTRPPSRPKSGQTEEPPKTETPVKPKPQIFSPAKPTTRPTRKSARIAFQSTSRPAKQPSPIVEEIDSSSEPSSDSDTENTSFKQGTPVFSESSEDKPLPAPKSTSTLPSKPSPLKTPKRKASLKHASTQDLPTEPQPKRAKKSTPSAISAKLTQLLQRRVVRGKVIKVKYFEEQGLGVFLHKLRAQGWYELFTNTQLGCSVHELAEFYANCTVTEGVVTSIVNGQQLRFDAKILGEILGIPSTGFDIYVREDKTILGTTRLLELSQKFSQRPSLQTPKSVKKGDMTSLHQLIFWFIIKNVIPRGQGRNLADAMDQCLMDLMDKEEQINLPAIMIRHIARIANTSREHDLGYGFFLTSVFEHFGVTLQKKVGAQFIDEIGSNTLMGCGYTLVEGSASEQGTRTPRPLVPGSSSVKLEAALEENSRLSAELTAVKAALDEEKALNAKRHEDLLALLSSLSAKFSPPAP